LTGRSKIVVIGDAVEPAIATKRALRLSLGERVEVVSFDWDAGTKDFAGAAFALETGESISVPRNWKAALKEEQCC